MVKDDLRDIAILLIVIIVIFAIAVWGAWNVRLRDDNMNAGKARCKSLQGEYGGGKCFKDGKEI